jgi:hypothetical protein
MGKSGPSAPPPAQQTAAQQQQFNQDDYRFQTRANNPNVYTPLGRITYSGSPGSTNYRQNITLNDVPALTFGNTQQAGANRSGVAEHISSQLMGQLQDPVDYSNFQDFGQLGDYDQRRQDAEDAAYGRATSRLDPQWDNQMENIDVQLRGQGLVPGDEAYDDAMQNFLRGRTDAYSAAQQDAVRQGREESNLAFNQQRGTADYNNALRTQQINEELQRRGWSINEINALLNGTNVGLPAANNYNPSGGMGRTDLLGGQNLAYQASLDQYNARQQQQQGLFGGITDVASFFF